MVSASRFDGRFIWAQTGLGWVALVLVLLLAVPQGGNQPIAWTLFALAILMLFGLQILVSLVRAPALALGRAVPLALIYGAVVAWGLTQALLPAPAGLAHPIWDLAPQGAAPRIGADPGAGVHIALRLTSYAMAAWIIAASALNSLRAWAYLKAIGLYSVVLALYGVWATLQGANPVLGLDEAVPSYVISTFVNRNSYATYAAFGMLTNIAIFLHMSARGDAEGGNALSGLRSVLSNFFGGAWLFLLAALICAVALALTQSRGGVAAGLLGLVTLLACLSRRGAGTQYALWGVVAVMIGFVAIIFGTGTWGRFLEGTFGGRLAIYQAIVAQIPERPWLGHGLGGFQDAFRPHVPLEVAIAEWDLAHNTYLENIYELGIPAAAALYLVLALVAFRLIRGLRVRETDLAIPALGLAVLVTGAAHSAVDFSLQMPGAAALFAALLAIAWAQSFDKDGRRSLSPREVSNDI